MSNPWLKKNPFMSMWSMWLSGANRIAGTFRGHASAQAKRQVNATMTEAVNASRKIWSEAQKAPPSGARAKRKR
jgi:hypothetical protein